MKVFVPFFTVSVLVLASAAQAGECPSTNVIQDPPPFLWQDNGSYFSGTLDMGEETFFIGNDVITTRAYGQNGVFSIPGPTMAMEPGETYVLTLKNTLDYQTPSLEHNVFKDSNITNIHTHGIHISGESPGDDVTRQLEGGFCGDYVYDIPEDHMGGTYWYHAHHHGSTYLQVSGGAFGLILVDDSGDGLPQSVAGMTERQLVVAYLDPDVAGTGGDTLISGTLSPTWTVNGAVEGNLCAPANEWQHWRVLIADRDARRKTLSVGPTCELALLARDGVWRSEAPKPLPTNSIELTGASRADLAVKCSADSTISVDGTVVANVIADPPVPDNPDVGPYDFVNNPIDGTWSATRPHYLRDLRDESGPVNTQNISMGARTINGDKFDLDVPTFNIDQPGIQEWTIKGATNHPFHLHIYHVQMQGECGDFEDGEYYDTVAASSCLVRFDASPEVLDQGGAPLFPATAYEGRTIMHCHILAHEDKGAMGWADVTFGIPPPIFPNTGFSEYYRCAGGPPVCEPTEPDVEVSCADGLDNDCDGDIDSADSDCAAPPPPTACSLFPDRTSCRSDRSCRWDNKNDLCIAK
jgi:FtsP/CotA-like multicopper oxidase with cupredoxin domain